MLWKYDGNTLVSINTPYIACLSRKKVGASKGLFLNSLSFRKIVFIYLNIKKIQVQLSRVAGSRAEADVTKS